MVLAWYSASAGAASVRWIDPAVHCQRFATVNGVRLHYLEWGSAGPTVIFIHGLGDNPHVFDDLAPAFTDRFRVIAYARRGHGLSESKAPYDIRTLTEDLLGLMDALGIAKAHLVGWSMGGSELTAMAVQHPERVDRVIYLDSFDGSDPGFDEALRAVPPILADVPARALASLDAFRAYEKRVDYTELDEMQRVEAYLRGRVTVEHDGRLRFRMPESVEAAMFAAFVADRREYAQVQSKALAIYARSVFDGEVPDTPRGIAALDWQHRYWDSVHDQSIARVRRELRGVEMLSVPGSHSNFFLISRSQVVEAMRRFLTETGS